VFESLDLSTDDFGRKPDFARSLLAVYESMRVEGLRELTILAPEEDDAGPRARDLASAILVDVRASGKHLPQLREFARRLLALSVEVSSQHFEALEAASTFSLGSIGMKSPARAAADELKKKIVPLLKQQWAARWYAGETALLREAIERIDAMYR
jgi:hypothetical protein